jgi:Methyltransferase FkbM domain
VFNTLSNKWVGLLKKESQSRFDEMHEFKETKQVVTTTLDKLIEQYGMPHYIKIDVEGFEKEVISGLHKKIAIIGFECNLPEFTEETLWIIDHLSKINSGATFNFIRDNGFELENNIGQNEMKALVIGGTFRFMDIYCFNE